MKRRHFVHSCSAVVVGAAFMPISLTPTAEPIKAKGTVTIQFKN